MSVHSVAADRFQADAIRRSDAVTRKALLLWGRVPPSNLDAGWAAIEAPLLAAVAAVVAQNAASSQQMVSRVARVDQMAAGDVIVPNAFVGIDSTGRDVGGLLHGSVTTTKEQIGRGVAASTALLSGASYLAAMTKTVIADMARSAGAVSSVNRGYVRMIRVVNAGACSRCAILAGSDRFSKHFERHPACKCTTVPFRDGDAIPDDLYASPGDHFKSLSAAEQDRIYTRAGAKAIRMGADPLQVVGARRGAGGIFYSRSYPAPLNSVRRMQRVPIGTRPDGTPIMGFKTIEGATKRGSYGRAQMNIGEEFARLGNARYSTAKRARLMPESIFEATSDAELRRVLLRDAGYLDFKVTDLSSNSWIQERMYMQKLDRITADTFYRSLGIDLY